MITVKKLIPANDSLNSKEVNNHITDKIKPKKFLEVFIRDY